MYLKGYLRRSSFLVKLQAYSLRLDWEISSFGGVFKDFTKSFRKSFFYSFFYFLFINLFIFPMGASLCVFRILHCSSKYCETVYCNIVFIDEGKKSNKKKTTMKHQPILRKKHYFSRNRRLCLSKNSLPSAFLKLITPVKPLRDQIYNFNK